MDGTCGTPRLLSIEEKWQIIFNERTRAPIYAVSQYIEYLKQFVNGQSNASRDTNVIRKDGISPISYLLRKLKLDMKMSYDSFIEEFLTPANNGIVLLIKLLKSIQATGSKQSCSTNLSQLKNYKKTLTDEHDCLLCIKFTMRTQAALPLLLEITYGLETIAMGLLSNFTKSRGTAIEILNLALSAEEGMSRVLDCFTFIRLKIGEPVRFKSLMNMMNLGSKQNVVFKVSCMRFLNSLHRCAGNMNTKVYLQHELETAGLDVDDIQKKTVGTGLEYDDLRYEIFEWKKEYINVDKLLTSPSLPPKVDDTDQQSVIGDLKSEIQILSVEKESLERKMRTMSLDHGRKIEKLKRKPKRSDVEIQCESMPVQTSSVACQSDIEYRPTPNGNDDPLRTAADYFGWQTGTGNPTEDEPIYYFNYLDNGNAYITHDVTRGVDYDDDTVDKVNDWLRSRCVSGSKCSINVPNARDNDLHRAQSHNRGGKFTRNPLHQSAVPSRTDITGNWRLVPKQIHQFPSRFPEHQCHATNCDRCDIHVRKHHTNSKPKVIIQKPEQTHKKESKSQSTDSAIGGSGNYARPGTSNDRRIPMLPTDFIEAERLQDAIQPDDSASGYQASGTYMSIEPKPDYCTTGTQNHTEYSYRSELSKVLQDFDGTLNKYDSLGRKAGPTYRKYIAMGDV